MARLLPIRDELLRGDTRPLYLGWLARLGNGELSADDREPPLPDGLKTLTPAQNALAEFLMLDPDWLAATAEKSPPFSAGSDNNDRFDPWLSELTEDEMRTALRMLLEGRHQEAERTLRRRFRTWEQERLPKRVASLVAPRCVSEIEARVSLHRLAREQQEREAHEAAEARRKAERSGYLTSLLEDEDSAWSAIDSKLQRGSGSSYDQASGMSKGCCRRRRPFSVADRCAEPRSVNIFRSETSRSFATLQLLGTLHPARWVLALLPTQTELRHGNSRSSGHPSTARQLFQRPLRRHGALVKGATWRVRQF